MQINFDSVSRVWFLDLISTPAWRAWIVNSRPKTDISRVTNGFSAFAFQAQLNKNKFRITDGQQYR